MISYLLPLFASFFTRPFLEGLVYPLFMLYFIAAALSLFWFVIRRR